VRAVRRSRPVPLEAGRQRDRCHRQWLIHTFSSGRALSEVSTRASARSVAWPYSRTVRRRHPATQMMRQELLAETDAEHRKAELQTSGRSAALARRRRSPARRTG
jgi:hypothetical protein